MQVPSSGSINRQNPLVRRFVLRDPSVRKMREENGAVVYFLFVTIMVWIRIEVCTITYAG